MRVGRLILGGRIDRYVGSLFAASYATAFLLVVGLALVLDLATNLDYFESWEDGRRAPTMLIVRYYALNVPFIYLQVAPFVTVVAGAFSVSRLMKHNEVVTALASGVSSQRLLMPIFLGGVLASLAMFGLREGTTRSIGARRDALWDLLENQREHRVYENLWLRDELGQVAHLGEFLPAVGTPPTARFMNFQATIKEEGVWKSIEAKEGVFVTVPEAEGGTGWQLSGGLIQEVGAARMTPRPVDMLQGIHFTPADALLSQKAYTRPLELSFGEVSMLAGRDPANVQFQTLMQYHLTFPLANVVLLLVVIPFMLTTERGKGVEGLALGAVLCVFYFALDFTTRTWGMEGALGPMMAAWIPVLVFGSLGVVFFDSMRS